MTRNMFVRLMSVRPTVRRILIGHAILMSSLVTSSSQAEYAEHDCGELNLENNVGPWDYHNPINHIPNGAAPKGNAKLVENAHFQKWTENLRDKDTYRLTGDIAYTLRAFPNHPRALLSLSRLEERMGKDFPGYRMFPRVSSKCFFERAFMFRPEDGRVWAMYALVLHRKKRYEEALAAYENSELYGQSSPQMDYNIGLLLMDLGRYDEALERAKRAFAAGFALPGLRRRLEAVGRTL